MDFKLCAQCGAEIEGNGVLFRNKAFCSDDCCDEFDDKVSLQGVPSLEDLKEDLDDDSDQSQADGPEDLGYRGDGGPDEPFDDDDFNIQEDDF